MDINELESYRLADAVKFHNRLNPRLWGRDEHLLPEVREHLLAIADDFREFLGIPDLEIQDITLSGSNAAYNYTPHSDVDLHLIVDVPDNAVYRELFNAKKYQYNDEHTLRIGPYDVELYVQDSKEPIVSQGVYSVRDGEWISVPKRKRAKINDISVRNKYEDMGSRVEQAIASGDAALIQRTIDKIKQLRKTGLTQHGEFSAENLAYKMLRAHGLIDQLYQAKTAAQDRALSITERKKKKRKKKVKYAYGGWWYPGFGYYGLAGSESGEGGGDGGGGGESVNETAMPQIRWIPVSTPFDFNVYVADGPRGVMVAAEQIEITGAGPSQWFDFTGMLDPEGTYNVEHFRPTRENDQLDWDEVAEAVQDVRATVSQLYGSTWPAIEAELSGGMSVELDEAALSSPDGVSPSTKMFLSEQEVEGTVKTFIRDTAKRLGIERMPRVFLHRRPDWSRQRHSFGMYDPETHELHVSLVGRHLLDILRTTAHELVHCRQNEIKPLPDDAGETGSRWENQAHAEAGRIMRDFADQHPELFAQDLREDIMGMIPAGTRRAIAGMCAVAGLSGCVTTDSLRSVQTLGRAVQSMERYGVAGAQEEITQELKNYLRARQGDPNAQNLSHIYRAEQQARQRETPAQEPFVPGRIKSRLPAEEPPTREDYDPNGPPPGPEFRPTMPAGTARVDVSDMYDWYKLGQHISNLKGLGRHDFGQGPPSTIIAFGSEPTEHEYIRDLERTGLTTTDIDPAAHKKGKKQKVDPTFNVAEATGYIPVNRTQAKDPRYSMAITQDIKPGEIQRQARKLGFATDAAGVPPLLIKDLKNLLENFKTGDQKELMHHAGHVKMVLSKIPPGYQGSRLHDKIMQTLIRRMGPIGTDSNRKAFYQRLASDIFDAYAKKYNLTERCWTGYRQAGMKKKGQRQVPNCVPVSEIGVPPVGPGQPIPQRRPRREPPWPGPGEQPKKPFQVPGRQK